MNLFNPQLIVHNGYVSIYDPDAKCFIGVDYMFDLIPTVLHQLEDDLYLWLSQDKYHFKSFFPGRTADHYSLVMLSGRLTFDMEKTVKLLLVDYMFQTWEGYVDKTFIREFYNLLRETYKYI